MMATTWDHLPEEMWLIIIAYLDAGSRRSLSVVNKYLSNTVKILLRKTDHWVLISEPHKLTRSMWRALQSRRSVKLLVQDYKEAYDLRDSQFDFCLIVKQLSNISALDVTLKKFTLSEVKQVSVYKNLNMLRELSITFTKTRPDAIRSLILLNAPLVRLSLTGTIDCENETTVGLESLARFTELITLYLDLRLFVAIPDNDMVYVSQRVGSGLLDFTKNLGNLFRSLKQLRDLSYSFSVDYFKVGLMLDLKPLEHLEQLSLKNATFMSASVFSNFSSLVTLSLVDFHLTDPCTCGSVFFRGLNHLKELTLKENTGEFTGQTNAYATFQQELPPSLTSLTVHQMVCTVGLCFYLEDYGKNLIYLELDAMKFVGSSSLATSLPEMCPNLQALLFRHMYCDAEMIMKFSDIKNLQLLEVHECRGCEDVDMTQLAETIMIRTDNKIRLFLGNKSNRPRKDFLSDEEWDNVFMRPSIDWSNFRRIMFVEHFVSCKND